MERKIYFLSPLEARVYSETEEGDRNISWSGSDLVGYQDVIKKKIEEEDIYTGSDLMEHYDTEDSIKSKVKSLEITIKEVNGELKGCAIGTITESLNDEEIETIKEYLYKQYSDGWGDSFRNQEIIIEEGDMYVNFCNLSNFEIEVQQEETSAKQKEGNQNGFVMRIDLKGPEGNIFFVQGRAIQILRKAGKVEKIDEMNRRIQQSGSYYRALDIINEYVRIEPDYRKQLQLKSEKRKADRER